MDTIAPEPAPAGAVEPYESPTVTDLGSFAELTRGMGTPGMNDNATASVA